MCSDKQFYSDFDLIKRFKLKPFFVFNFCAVCLSENGKFFLVWFIPKEYVKLLGKKIRWFECFRKYNLCKKNLKRIHLTCLRCKLRKVVSGEQPFVEQVSLHIIPLKLRYGIFHKILIKNFLSICESLT